MKRKEYSAWLSEEAVDFLLTLSKGKRRKVLDLADSIAAQPFKIGDFQQADTTGRMVETVLVEEFLFSYWVDHATKEVRVTEILQP